TAARTRGVDRGDSISRCPLFSRAIAAHWSVLAWRDRMTWADAKRTWRRRSHTCVERRRDDAAAAAEQRPCAPAPDLGPTRRPVPPISRAGGWDRGNGAAWRRAGRWRRRRRRAGAGAARRGG